MSIGRRRYCATPGWLMIFPPSINLQQARGSPMSSAVSQSLPPVPRQQRSQAKSTSARPLSGARPFFGMSISAETAEVLCGVLPWTSYSPSSPRLPVEPQVSCHNIATYNLVPNFGPTVLYCAQRQFDVARRQQEGAVQRSAH
jgi:hypothetical protein